MWNTETFNVSILNAAEQSSRQLTVILYQVATLWKFLSCNSIIIIIYIIFLRSGILASQKFVLLTLQMDNNSDASYQSESEFYYGDECENNIL